MNERPIILGIVGDSAAGKTTITAGLVNILGPDAVTHVCTDDYHKFDRKERLERGITPLAPDCNYLDVLEQHIQRLRYGQPILKPVYDHAAGMLVRPEYVVPRRFVIVEGLLGFSTATLRQFFDIKVFLSPPEEVRRIWKIKRDTTRRGYTTEQVLAELDRRENDSRNHIRPQSAFADIVVKFYPPAGWCGQPNGNLNVRLVLRPTIPHPDLSYLMDAEESTGVRLLLGRDEGRPADFLEIDGNVAARHAGDLENAIWQHLPDLRPVSDDQFGEYQDRREQRHSPPLALTQLLVTYHLLRKLNDLSPGSRQAAASEWMSMGAKLAGLG